MNEPGGFLRRMPVIDLLIGKESIVVPDGCDRPFSSNSPGPNGEVIRRDTICLGRSGGDRRGRIGASGGGSDRPKADASPAHSGEVPFLTVHIINRDESRLTSHGEADILRDQLGVDLVTSRSISDHWSSVYGLVTARRLIDARDLHGVAEFGFALVHCPGDRRCAGRLRGAGERDVALAGEKARGGVKTHPTGAREKDLAPSVEVGEIRLRSGGTIEGLSHPAGVGLSNRRRSERRGPDAEKLGRATRRCRDRTRNEARNVSSGVCTPGSNRIR